MVEAETKTQKGSSRLPLVVLLLLCIVLLIIMIVLAALYGSDHNCVEAKKSTLKGGPAMVQYAGFKTSFAVNSSLKYSEVAHSMVPGKQMTGGLLELKGGESFSYTQWYDGFLYCLDGSFDITDGTGSTITAAAGDALVVKQGTKVTYKGKPAAKAYYVANPPGPVASYTLKAAIDANPSVTVFRQINTYHSKKTGATNIPLFTNKQNSLSYLKDLLVSPVKGRELAGGLYELGKGPALDYTYEYEEFKYIISGVFELTDGTGKFVTARGGDLMYFPIGCAVHFTSPSEALGFYVGQRAADTA
jgi:ethanolamine utilization protein EutQ (cupin superfamily)